MVVPSPVLVGATLCQMDADADLALLLCFRCLHWHKTSSPPARRPADWPLAMKLIPASGQRFLASTDNARGDWDEFVHYYLRFRTGLTTPQVISTVALVLLAQQGQLVVGFQLRLPQSQQMTGITALLEIAERKLSLKREKPPVWGECTFDCFQFMTEHW